MSSADWHIIESLTVAMEAAETQRFALERMCDAEQNEMRSALLSSILKDIKAAASSLEQAINAIANLDEQPANIDDSEAYQQRAYRKAV